MTPEDTMRNALATIADIAERSKSVDCLPQIAMLAREALQNKPRDDGTTVVVGGEPGASEGKSE
jgi:hypothetical protein